MHAYIHTHSYMSSTTHTIRTIYIGDNPVNSLGSKVRTKILHELREAALDADVKAVILIGSSDNKKEIFSAGADIREFQKSPEENIGSSEEVPSLVDLCNFVEGGLGKKPIVAAVRGFALGGGMELALACDYRVADKTAKFGLPEVNIGLIPGAGGTQRLPRLTSLEFALDVICTGRTVRVREAVNVGLVDAVTVNGQTLEECAIQWASWAAQLVSLSSSSALSERKIRKRKVVSNVNKDASIQFLSSICQNFTNKIPSVAAGGEAKQAAVEAIKASFATKNFEDGCSVEDELFWKLLLHSEQGRARRHAFFAERLAQQRPVIYKAPIAPKKVFVGKECVGVIGAGTMGTGIAISFLRAGYPRVCLLDVNEKGLARGCTMVRKVIQDDVKKGRLSPSVAEDIVNRRLLSSSSYDSLKNCEVIVEAVFENLELKKKVFATLDDIVLNKEALLLTNTSTLDVDMIAEALHPSRREFCLGMHFFSPAHIMKLVEIVRSKYTSDRTIAFVRAHTRKISKIGVVVNNCDGFVGNRMIRPYTTEMLLLLEGGGCDVLGIDNAIRRFGMALGPFQMSDLAGNDIGYLIKKERRAKGLLYARESDLGDKLVEKFKRIGQKALKGWYNYDTRIGNGRVPLPSQEVSDFVESYRIEKGITPLQQLPSNAIVERLMYPLINEGFKILEENVAYSPSDIDVIYLYGYGWPIWKGGPMYYADNFVGLPSILSKLEEFSKAFPGSDYYIPSKLLRNCVENKVGVQKHYDSLLKSKSKL